jgi:hypothetical protein
VLWIYGYKKRENLQILKQLQSSAIHHYIAN